MKRFPRAIAVLASALVAGAGLTVVTLAPAQAATIGTLTHSSSLPTIDGSVRITTSGACPTGTGSIVALLSGGNIPSGQEVVGTGTNTASVADNPVSVSFDLTLRDIAANTTPSFDFRPAVGAATYTTSLYCVQNEFGLYSDTDPIYSGQFTVDAAGGFAPAVVQTATTVALTASPASGAVVGQSVTFTADVDAAGGAAPAGSVQFSRAGTNLGTPVAVNGAGVATYTTTSLPTGTADIVAAFTGTGSFGSSEATISYTVGTAPPVPAVATTSTLSVDPLTGPSYQQVTLSGTVAAASGTTTPAGTCTFRNGTATLATVPVAAGACSLQTTALTGSPALSFVFTPTDAAAFAGSTSNTVTATYDPPAPPVSGDDQTIVVTVPAGNLTIFTPYTPEAPLNLGTMTLNAEGTAFTAGNRFDAVTVTDTRGTNPGWTASLAGADFVGATPTDVIPVGKSSFTGIVPRYISGNAIQAGDVTTTDLPSLTTAPQAFARAAAGNGLGSVDILADFTLSDVATSTKPGQYTATVVFTVS